MQQSPTIENIAKALAAFQAANTSVTKDSVNPFFHSKYASLDSIIMHVRDNIAKNGLSYAQFPDENKLTTILMHTSGEWMSATADLMIKDVTPQAHGSAITYMRRYALSSILGIATDEDDDGNRAEPIRLPIQSKVTQQLSQVVCDKCGKNMELRPAGVSRAGIPYDAFYSCGTMDGSRFCGGKPRVEPRPSGPMPLEDAPF